MIQRRVTAEPFRQCRLVQQRAALAAEQAALPPLEQQELEARNALAILLGRPPEGFAVAGENLGAPMPPAVAPGLPSALLTRRPDHRRRSQSACGPCRPGCGARAFCPPSASPPMAASPIRRWRRRSTLPGVGSGGRRRRHPGANHLRRRPDRRKDRGKPAREEELLAAYRAAVIASFSDVENALGSLSHLSAQKPPCANR